MTYPTNTVLGGAPDQLGPVVQRDLFTAEVTVVGYYSYATQNGGNTTAPELLVDTIKVTGTTST